MNERGRNESDISRYTDVEYSPEGYKTVYRWGDFLEIAGGHVYNAMDTIDLVSTGGEYEGFTTRDTPIPASSSVALPSSTASRCSGRCPAMGRT